MSRDCDAIGCKDPTASGKFMCLKHWRMVPIETQRTVYDRYRALRKDFASSTTNSRSSKRGNHREQARTRQPQPRDHDHPDRAPQLKLTDSQYYVMLLELGGVDSSKDLDAAGRARVIAHLKVLGFKPTQAEASKRPRRPMPAPIACRWCAASARS
jgi:hypothetical protein